MSLCKTSSPVEDTPPPLICSRSNGYRVVGERRQILRFDEARDGFRRPGEARHLLLPDARFRGAEPMQAARTAPTPLAASWATERRRLERDLHDGVQNELVALIVKLALVQQDPRTPPALAHDLAGLEARAQSALDSVRDIVRGIYPPLLSDFGLETALRSQAARSPIRVSVAGTAPRSIKAGEEAVYFVCSEAIQNATKHAGRTAKVNLRLHYRNGALVVRIADDGRGFDPARTSTGAGLQNIRERIGAVGGVLEVASRLGRGTVLTLSLPWPAPAGGAR